MPAGEYVAAEKIEAAYKKSSLVEQIWVYGNSLESTLVAVVVPTGTQPLLLCMCSAPSSCSCVYVYLAVWARLSVWVSAHGAAGEGVVCVYWCIRLCTCLCLSVYLSLSVGVSIWG